jgi:putative intracellular protease/amidase
MKKILMYIYDDMADFEVTLLAHLLGRNSGYRIISISETIDPVSSASGLTYLSKTSINKVIDEDVEGIIIPGGWKKGYSEDLMRLLRDLNEQNRFIAAICAGPWMVAKSGALKGKKFTTSISAWTEEQMKNFCKEDPFEWTNYQDSRIVRDENIITAKGVAFIDFATEVCDYLGEFKNTKEKDEFVNQFVPGNCNEI